MRRPSYLHKEIFHPNETDAERPHSVTIRYVTRSEREDFEQWLRDQRVAEGVADPDTGKPIRDEIKDVATGQASAGDAQIIFRLKGPAAKEAQIRSLALYIVGWRNHLDENGNEIPFTRENLPTLGEQYLDVTTDEDVTTPATDSQPEKVERKPVTRRWTTYLAMKAADVKTFDSDPLASGSAKP